MGRLRLDRAQVEQELAQTAAGLVRMSALGAEIAGVSADPVTPRKYITDCLGASLYRYGSGTGRPVLLIYAMVNRPRILDLDEDHSMVRRLLDQGLDVYLLEWADPGAEDASRPLGYYLLDVLGAAVSATCARAGTESVALLGVCQGGTLALCHAALRPERVGGIVTLVTPVDFQTPADRLSALARDLRIADLAQLFGNFPGTWLHSWFLALRPFQLTIGKYLDAATAAEQADDGGAALRHFLAVENWLRDCPDQPGKAFSEFVTQCYQQNALMKKGLAVGEEIADLRQLQRPVLNIHASEDRLVPVAASVALEGLLAHGDDYSELSVRTGHIGAMISRRALASIPKAVAEWVNQL